MRYEMLSCPSLRVTEARLAGPDGTTLLLREGARVSWRGAAGLDVTITGRVAGMTSDASGLRVLCVEADPSARLRELAAEARRYMAAHPLPPLPFFYDKPIEMPKSGLDGEGGEILFMGEAAESAAACGLLTLIEDAPEEP